MALWAICSASMSSRSSKALAAAIVSEVVDRCYDMFRVSKDVNDPGTKKQLPRE